MIDKTQVVLTLFPHCDLKQAYLERYERRGSPYESTKLVDKTDEEKDTSLH